MLLGFFSFLFGGFFLGILAALVLSVMGFNSYIRDNKKPLVSIKDKTTWKPFFRFERYLSGQLIPAIYMFISLLVGIAGVFVALGLLFVGGVGVIGACMLIGLVFVMLVLIRVMFELQMLNITIAKNTQDIADILKSALTCDCDECCNDDECNCACEHDYSHEGEYCCHEGEVHECECDHDHGSECHCHEDKAQDDNCECGCHSSESCQCVDKHVGEPQEKSCEKCCDTAEKDAKPVDESAEACNSTKDESKSE